MSKSQVLADIQAKIKTNGNQEITGDILQGVLTESVNLVPENVSDLTNDVKYQTEEEVNDKVKVVSDEVDNVKAAQTSQATDITTLQEGLSAANNSIQEVTATVATKANQADLDSKVNKTGYTQSSSDKDFIVKTGSSVELFKIPVYSDEVLASVAVKGVEIYPLNSVVEGWYKGYAFRAQVVNSTDQPQFRLSGVENNRVQLAVNYGDSGDAYAPVVLIRRGIGLCDYNDQAIGSAFMQGYGSFNILNTNGEFEINYLALENAETGDVQSGPFKSYTILQFSNVEPRDSEGRYGAQGVLHIQGDVVAQITDEDPTIVKEYKLSQIGDIQTALQAILGN